jgi:hypothetical protein
MKRALAARIGATIAALTLGTAMLLAPTAASSAVVTSIQFETASPVSVAFGDSWFLRLSITSAYEDGPTLRLGPNDGTVDVYFSGIGAAFAKSLPIQPDGLVYVTQPDSQPLLPAGEYQVTAIYNPASGGYYASAQTATPLAFTVTALAVSPKVEVIYDAAVSERPVITASLSGSYPDARGGAPAGTWHFIVTDPEDQPIFDESFPLPQGSTEPFRVEIDSKLAKGESYKVVSAFTPVDELAGGITGGDISDSVFQTPGGTFAEAITGAVPIPVWLAILLLVVLLGLATAAIIVGVRLRGRSAIAGAAAPGASQRVPGDPLNVELGSLYDLGLPDPETIPELIPEGETKRLPISTTWLLSDVEPATGLPDASEAQTERLDTVTAAELPTEIISTGPTHTSAAPDVSDESEAVESDDVESDDAVENGDDGGKPEK